MHANTLSRFARQTQALAVNSAEDPRNGVRKRARIFPSPRGCGQGQDGLMPSTAQARQ